MNAPELASGPPAPPANGLTPVPSGAPGSPAVVAFYLPQYHPIPENDAWWAEGFTDWVNVAAARPLYPGHAVPSVPADLGAYDLRSRDARASQAELARSHGVHGFCYYFYWFGGRRLLEQPLDLMLDDGQPDLPFCLCWANEPWTRRWDGRESDILMPQHHDRLRDLALLDDLMPYFEDPRYIRIDGHPVLLIYRQGLLDDAAGFTGDLRAEAVRRGLPGLYLCNVMSIGDVDRRAEGFDAAVEFPPHGTLGVKIDPRSLGADPAFRGRIYDYASVVQTALARPVPSFSCFPAVMPRWDNTARKRLAAHIFHGSTPELFERWLRRAVSTTARVNPDAPLAFVNSWNEWAEGAHLEPDQQMGRHYLEVIRRVVRAECGEDSGLEADLGDTGGGASALDSGQGLMPGRAAEEMTLRPGMPDEAREASASDGVIWIDDVDGRPLRGHIIRAARGQTLWLRGWFYGDSRHGVGRGSRGYLLLSSGDATWHAQITERQRRTDVLRGMLARDQRSRKLIKAIDRLPTRVGQQALRLWAFGRDHVGFEVRVQLGDLPTGRYRVGFVDVVYGGPVAVVSEFTAQVG